MSEAITNQHRETGNVWNFGIDAAPVSYMPTIISNGAVVLEVLDKVYVTNVKGKS